MMTMFGKPAVEVFEQAVESQHHALRDFLGDLTTLLANAQWTTAGLAELLNELREHLREHFVVEEQGGYFHEALAILPQLGPQAVALQRQHDGFLATVDGLLGRMGSGELSAEPRSSIETELREFVDAMRKHEAGEIRILQLAYNEDLGSVD
jgi:hypothetical protein